MNLFRKIKHLQFNILIRKILFFFNINIYRTTDKNDLFSFLSKIQPVKTNISLIRVGDLNDGGYLIPDDLVGIENCFSPGVANVSEFEKDLVKRGISCYCADGSVDGLHLINESNIIFIKKHLGIMNSDSVITLESWVGMFVLNNNDLILQMDIERGEYGVLIDTSNDILLKFRIIVIEFHNIHAWVNAQEFSYIKMIFEKILKNFTVVHIHPNNCDDPLHYSGIDLPGALEFTFLRNDRIKGSIERVFDYPHPLDSPNVFGKNDITLNIFDYLKK